MEAHTTIATLVIDGKDQRTFHQRTNDERIVSDEWVVKEHDGVVQMCLSWRTMRRRDLDENGNSVSIRIWTRSEVASLQIPVFVALLKIISLIIMLLISNFFGAHCASILRGV